MAFIPLIASGFYFSEVWNVRKSGLTGDEAYILSKHGKTTEDLGSLKKEVSLLKEDLGNIQIDKLPIYTSSVVNANKDIFDGSVTNITDGPNVIGGDFIGKITVAADFVLSYRNILAGRGSYY